MCALATAVLIGAALATLTVALVGCGTSSTVGDAGTIVTTGGTESTTTTVPTTSTTAPAKETTTTTAPAEPTTTTLADNMMIVSVYFVRDEKITASHRVILKTLEVGKTAMRELLSGPTTVESNDGMASTIPTGTALLGLDVNNGVATVNLSKEYASGGGSLSMPLRLAQVVYTLTQFPTVNRVSFELDGKAVEVFGGEGIILNGPVGRTEYEDVTPAILVESPTSEDAVSSPVRITGTANTFEGMFMAKILDETGATIAERSITAQSGTGQRGGFDVSIPYYVAKAGPGTLIVFEESAQDGSQTNLVTIPLILEK